MFGAPKFWCFILNGEGGIRTHDTVTGTPDFESGAFSLSATSPCFAILLQRAALFWRKAEKNVLRARAQAASLTPDTTCTRWLCLESSNKL